MDQDQAFQPYGSENNRRYLEGLIWNEYLRSTRQHSQPPDPTLETNIPDPLDLSANLALTLPPPPDPRDEVLSKYTIRTIPVPSLHPSSEGIDWGFDDDMLRQLAPIEGRIPQDIANTLMYDPGKFPTSSPTHPLSVDAASYLPALAISAFPNESGNMNTDAVTSNTGPVNPLLSASKATSTDTPTFSLPLPARLTQPSQPQVSDPVTSSSGPAAPSSAFPRTGRHRQYTHPFKRLVLHYLLTERIHDTLRGIRIIRQPKVNEAARHFEIPPSTVRDWWKSRGRYMAAEELRASGEAVMTMGEEAGHGDGTRYTARVLAWLDRRGAWREGNPDEAGEKEEDKGRLGENRNRGAGNRQSVWSLN